MKRVGGFSLLLAALLLGACDSGDGDVIGGGGGGNGGISNPTDPRTRYSLANQCFALRSNLTGKYVARTGDGYAASADGTAGAELFFLKPAALGSYLLYDRTPELMTGGAPVSTQALADATDDSVWTVTALGDATAYPPAPAYDVEPDPATIAAYRAFRATEPNVRATAFRLTSADGQALTVDGAGALTLAAASPGGVAAESFTFDEEPLAGCEPFPEATSSVRAGDRTFTGATNDGRVLGLADVHVHISSTTFLGKGQSGSPFHKFGVTHALGDCAGTHGEGGSQDVIGAFLGNDTDGHDTVGWPTFNDWPAAHALTHQAIYWKWLERAWMAGLRIAVNDLVENGTLCELQRNNSGDPALDCNEMNSAGRQAGTMYAMQDYIDAQYGGRGAGWFQIAFTPDEARDLIEAGKLAVVLGIEVSNFLNCQVTYNPNPLRKEPFEEPADGGVGENTYTCRMTETGADDEILTQLERIWNLGVRQVISIHEFDNAFGGNGIFFPVINVGNRENSGGIPAGESSGGFQTSETPTGEFWTTYACPAEVENPGPDDFSGYLWEDAGGAEGAELRAFAAESPFPATCLPTGQGGRYGGTTPCYPDGRQCNARWMTPIGLYMYGKLMEMGFIFDFDHMELEMKDQALELAEAQPIAYPFVSTHGTYGGTSNDQARRVLANGGFLYPSVNSSAQIREDLDETLAVYNSLPLAQRGLFGFGFGTDTNGLSDQAGAEPDVSYPYTLFDGPVFNALPDFDRVGGVVFNRPNNVDPAGTETRAWDITTEGSAHYGMLSDMVEGMRAHGTRDQMRYLYNSAERYLLTWEHTLDSQAAITFNGGVLVPPDILRAAPTP
jgi:hypothetical protein